MKKQRAGLYLRLSREDNEKENLSQSIQNQRDFLLNYCARQKIAVVSMYIDDGFSGTNFSRPGFFSMIEDIENKKINLVLTKDLSRLGRDYILTGHYLERYFPEHGVRFIAVNDGIDTANEQSKSDMTPFRAVFNDMYAKDISQKVRASLTVKRQRGQFVGAFAPYGYQKDPNDKNHLIVDETQAAFVRCIFQWFLGGETLAAIARKLNLKGVAAPYSVKKMTAAACKKDPTDGWNSAAVRRILTMAVYKGDLVSHLTQKISYKIDQKRILPKEEWIAVAQTHEAIVSVAEFDAVQQKLGARKRTKKNQAGIQKLFQGLLFCADCSAPMILGSNGTYQYFLCARWKKAPQKHSCQAHRIRETALVFAVDMTMQTLLWANIRREAVLQKAAENQTDREALIVAQKQLARKQAQVNRMIVSLYKNKCAGRIGETEFRFLCNKLHTEEDTAQNTYDKLRIEQENQRDNDRMGILAGRILSCEKLSRGLLLGLVERIEVTEGKALCLFCNFSDPYHKFHLGC